MTSDPDYIPTPAGDLNPDKPFRLAACYACPRPGIYACRLNGCGRRCCYSHSRVVKLPGHFVKVYCSEHADQLGGVV